MNEETSRLKDPAWGRVLRCWGKTDNENPQPDRFHPAIYHMLDAGNIARELLGKSASPRWRCVLARSLGATPEDVIDWIPWLVALHDIGKISAEFQGQIDAQKFRLKGEGFSFGRKSELQHALIGQTFIWENGEKLSKPPLSAPLRKIWRDTVGGHHGQFCAPAEVANTRAVLRKDEPPEWASLRLITAESLTANLLMKPPESWPDTQNISAAIMALTGFTILCDWLGSNRDYFQIAGEMEYEDYALESNRRAHTAVVNSGFFQPFYSLAPTSFARLFPDRAATIRPLQQAIDDIPEKILATPCLAVIEAPTGEGKTEAALALAHRLAQASGSDEIYYALPTTATSNQMFLRLQHYFQDQLGLTTQVKLIHGQAFLQEDDLRITPLFGEKDSFAALEWFGPKKRALLAPFGVGTVDQVELGALNVRHNALRLVGLAGKVLILDEVHAYDTYMTSIIERLLNWLSALGTSVILLSATLPCSRRLALAQAYCGKQDTGEVKLSAYPSLWIVYQAGRYLSNPPAQQASRQIQLDWLNMDDESYQAKAEWLLKAVSEGGCACWITNTVERAQKIFECVDRMAAENIDRQLLHARFPLSDRQNLEQRLAQNYGPDGSRPVRGIVVGTQVLEQSLDLDFDVMVSDLAPVDLLLQRAGRLHRHAHHPRPNAHRLPHLYINASLDAAGGLDVGVDRWIYPDFLLRKTFQILTGLFFLDLPSGYRSLVEAVYDAPPPAKSEPLGEAWQKLQEKEDKALQEAQLRLLPPPDAEDSFCGPAAARTVFEENENSAAWIVAQTRLGEESITVIPLERKDNQVFIPGSVETMHINQPVPRDLQLRLLRSSLRISHTAVVQTLRASRENLPGMFTSSPLLKDCLPLWLSNGQARFPARNGFLKLNLDARLGLVISKERG